MTIFRQIQFNPQRMLLCSSFACGKTARPPVIRSLEGADGPVLCEECGERMMLVDAITVENEATWRGVYDYDRAPLYTYATPVMAIVAQVSRDAA